MRIFIAGATGVIGRTLIANLKGQDLVGLTRRPEKAELLSSLGVKPVVGDAFDAEQMRHLIVTEHPEIVVNFLTDLSGASSEANARIRRDAGPIIVAATQSAGARHLVVESIAFALEGAPGEAVAALEQDALASGLEALVLRFGRFWGPGTWDDAPPEAPRVHVDEAGRRAAELIVGGETGVRVIAESPGEERLNERS
jgi:uncharacterized protein YbjT (DUF2867 family)